MCGIVALLPGKNTLLGSDSIKSMGDLIRHRGPDDEGYAFFQKSSDFWSVKPFNGPDSPISFSVLNQDALISNVAVEEIYKSSLIFCHRRLSIIDLSPAGHQPMSYLDRYWIIYNGEVYNYLELKIELERKGYKFNTHSDTEVILASYHEWGSDCLNRFVGMWAFLIFDIKTGILFGSRDRFGIKPLYYWFSPNGDLAFASEIKAFTVLPGWLAVVNGQRAYDFLIHGLGDHTSETMFQGVFQIRGGECFTISLHERPDSLKISNWYKIPDSVNNCSFDEGYERFKNLLINSVKIHLRSDVSVGSCLSGGLDSSSIVCLINSILSESKKKEHQKTFSACSHERKWDEREYIDEVVRDRDIDAYYIYPEMDQLFNELSSLLWHQDEPFGSTSIYAQWCVFRLTREQRITVLLDGQGSDEFIAGYHYFFEILIAEYIRQFSIFKLIKESLIISRDYHKPLSQLMKGALFFLLPSSRLGKMILMQKNSNTYSPSWLSIDKLNNANPSLNIEPHYKRYDLVTNYCLMQTFHTSLPFLLHYEDRNSMAYSRESRVPFLDHRLVEFVIGLSPDHKIRDGITKRILRGAMENILPEKVRKRSDKLGFATPEEYWVKVQAPHQFRSALEQAINCSHGILNEKALQYFDDMIEGREDFSFSIWRMIIFGEWMNLFKVKPSQRIDDR